MIKIAVLLLVTMIVGSPPKPGVVFHVPAPKLNMDGTELQAISAACVDMPKLMGFGCTSAKMARIKVDLFEEPGRYRVLFSPFDPNGRTIIFGGGVFIDVSTKSYSVIGHEYTK